MKDIVCATFGLLIFFTVLSIAYFAASTVTP